MECIAGPDAVGIGARAGNHAIHPSPRQNPIFQIYLNRSGGVIADVRILKNETCLPALQHTLRRTSSQ
ncbi:hypothetical protein SH139x_004241 [Planctomycetaceae bacterium SH139]